MLQMNLFSKQNQSHRCRKQTYGYQGGRGRGMNWEIGIDICTLLILRIKQITNENQTYSSGNSTQFSVVTKMGSKSRKRRRDMCMLCCAKSLQSCPTLCNPVNCSPPGSSVYGILQARILEWAAMLSTSRSSRPRDQTHGPCSSCIAGRFFTAEPPEKPGYVYMYS